MTYDRSPFSAMRVNPAAQVLSHSVAAGRSTLSIVGKLIIEIAICKHN